MTVIEQVPDLAATPTMRAQALRSVLAASPSIGVEQAVATYGAVLTREDRSLVLSLSTEELADLGRLSGELGELDQLSVDTNNNL